MYSLVKILVAIGGSASISFGVWYFFVPAIWKWYFIYLVCGYKFRKRVQTAKMRTKRPPEMEDAFLFSGAAGYILKCIQLCATSLAVKQKLEKLCNDLSEGQIITSQAPHLQISDLLDYLRFASRNGHFALIQGLNPGEMRWLFGHNMLMVCESGCRCHFILKEIVKYLHDYLL